MAVRITRAGVWLTVGIIGLTLLVLGGLYLAAQRGEQARRDEAIAIAEKNLSEQSKNETPALGGGDTNSDETTSKPVDGAASGSTNTGTTGSATTGTNNATGGLNSATGGANSVAELPQTGPASDLAAIAIIGLVTYFVASFISSRKNLLRNTQA